MPDPTASSFAAAAGAGFGAAVLSTIGVEPQPLFWALIGATLGLSLAAEAGRVRAVAVFGAVVFASALLGTWAAQRLELGSHARNGCALLIATLFHPLFSAAIAQVPGFVASLAARLGAVFGGTRS